MSMEIFKKNWYKYKFFISLHSNNRISKWNNACQWANNSPKMSPSKRVKFLKDILEFVIKIMNT